MKIRLADYVVNRCVDYGIDTCFSVVGGGAMNLNDAFGHNKRMKVIYNHHEQACSIGAEGYARVNNKMAAVCVTTGPGGINALNGVAGAYIDSVPMLVISGQVRRDSFSGSTGLKLRAMGDQEFNIVQSVKNMTKFAEIVNDKNDIEYLLSKAIHIATHGRKGPVWLDIPGDIQSAIIDTDKLRKYDFTDEKEKQLSDDTIEFIIDKIKKSKRPVLYAGSAIRNTNSYNDFCDLIQKLNIPVVTAWNSSDVIESDNPLYAGRPGNFGDRPGNFAVQNSDLILSIGCRLSIRQVGFNYASWAPNSYVIMVDIDEEELKKPTIHVELPVCCDCHLFIKKMLLKIGNENKVFRDELWITKCKEWIRRYPVVEKKHYEQEGIANAYAIVDILSKKMPTNMITVSGNGTACVVGGHGYTIKKGMRFIENSGMASMGWDLPAAVGSCFALGCEPLVCLTGDGSIQMNIQELQTIVHHNLPIKIIIINNNGYHSIRQSQSNFFKGNKLCGVGPESLDLSFPDMGKISRAYGIKFIRCQTNEDFDNYMNGMFLDDDGPQICEVMVDTIQYFQPKAGSIKREDGTMMSAPLENLVPYLSREELDEIMEVSKKI